MQIEGKLFSCLLIVLLFWRCGRIEDTKGFKTPVLPRDSVQLAAKDSLGVSKNTSNSLDYFKKDTMFHKYLKHSFDNSADSFYLFKMQDTFYFATKNAILNLHTDGLNAIKNDSDEDFPFVIFDFGDRRERFVAFLIPDSIFIRQSLLKIFSLTNNTLAPRSFFHRKNKFYPYLIAKNDFAYINTNKFEIFCETFTISDTMVGLKYNIDKYVYDTSTSRVMLRGSKFFTDTIFKKPELAQF